MAKKKPQAKKEQSKGYTRLTELAGKARTEIEKILKIIGKEADLSSKVLRERIETLNLDTKITEKYRELGKEAYNLVGEGKITEEKLKAIAVEIDKLYDRLEQKKEQIDNFKQEMKTAVKSE